MRIGADILIEVTPVLDTNILRSNTAQGTINAAWSPTDAMSEEILGRVVLAGGDFEDYTNNQMVFKELPDDGMGVILEPTEGFDLYLFGVSRGTPTFSASGLVIKIGLSRI